MTLRKRLLDNNSDASLLKTAAGMDIEYLQTPASGKKPSITVQRTRTGFTVTPDDDSLAYMAAGRLEEGRFITETYDTSAASRQETHHCQRQARHTCVRPVRQSVGVGEFRLG